MRLLIIAAYDCLLDSQIQFLYDILCMPHGRSCGSDLTMIMRTLLSTTAGAGTDAGAGAGAATLVHIAIDFLYNPPSFYSNSSQ